MSDADRSECWFLKFKSDVGIGRACNRTGDTCFPFLLRARRAKRSECWFLKFQSDVGIGGACNRTGNTANPRLGFGAFFSPSLSFLKSLISLRGDTKDATRKAREPPFAF